MTAQPYPRKAEPIRGWLAVYLVVLAVLLLHGLELTIASAIIYADPAVANLTEPIPLPSFVFYVVTNVLLILYTIVLFVLMFRRKRSAIAHNAVFNVLSVVFLIAWFLLSMKSTVGVVVDSVPNIVLLIYILSSRRVRRTLSQ